MYGRGGYEGDERREQSDYGGRQEEYGGGRQEYGGGRQEYGGDRGGGQEYGGGRQEYGGGQGYGGGQQYGGGRQEYSGGRQEYGGGRQEYSGGRQEYGGGRQEYGGRQESGGRQYPQGGNMTHGGGYPAGAGVPHDDDEDYRSAADAAAQHAGGSGDSGFFSNILGSLTERKSQVANEDVDEDDAVQSHRQFFGNSAPPQGASTKSMGSAAAMQALKMFSGGQGGGQSQSQFIAMAMGEASKLFDQQASQGNVEEGGSKDSTVMHAGEMALKMYMKSQGGGGGGAGGLLGFASKFM